ncbi:hypothetical protein OIDMADRAFT_58501 [Oidiodendron maius Zn]|uniref:Copper transporter n=1 Tax=Oidiodendron maius (strain Zn) TaxID=913774 RepID=A0A0C3CDC7_OIDMZ|nr:hypothetical protein OIDMADRAFT_58501 [Oidiodendron maius Zn]
MKPSSPLSLLLFIHLTSASPLPSLSLECQRFRSCDSILSQRVRRDHPSSDPYSSTAPIFSNPEGLLPPLKEQLKESLTPPNEDASSKYLNSNSRRTAELPADPWTARSANTPESANTPAGDQQGEVISETEEDAYSFSWCDKTKPLCVWQGAAAYSELFVVSIVVIFVLVVLVCEGVGRKTIRRLGRIYPRDQDQNGILSHPAVV